MQKKKLAIFDIDFTITKKETMVELLKFLLKKHPFKFWYLFNSLFGFIRYALGIIDEKKSKEIHLSFLKGFSKNEFNAFINDYYQNQFKKVLLLEGINKIKELHDEGFTIILSSASPEFYLEKLYEFPEITKIMGSKFSFSKDGLFESKMIGNNNKGSEKVKRLFEYIPKEDIDLENSLMFSDSLSDSPLLELVGKGYLINYIKKQSKYEVLNWNKDFM